MKSLSGYKIAVLASNGFEETQFLMTQKKIQEMGAQMVLVSSNQGLVNGWHGNGWGHNYMVDVPLNTALGVDYDAVIVIGGERSLEKLKLTAHTRRFISSFMNAQKPVCAMGDAVYLLRDIDQISDRKVSSTDSVCLDSNLLTGACNAENLADYMTSMQNLMMDSISNIKQAA